MTKIVDSSFVHEDPAQVRSLGYQAMLRYLAVDNASTHRKIVTVEEARAIWAAGLALVLAYEYGATSDTWNGDVARAEADALGWPTDRPIYWCEDRYVPPSLYDTIAARLDDHGGRSRRPRGIYGGAQLVQAMLDGGHAQFGLIASALSWSHAKNIDEAIAAAPGAHLMQLVGSPLDGTDESLVLKADYGQWPNTAAPAVPTTTSPEDLMDFIYVRRSRPNSLNPVFAVTEAAVTPVVTFRDHEWLYGDLFHQHNITPGAGAVKPVTDTNGDTRTVIVTDDVGALVYRLPAA